MNWNRSATIGLAKVACQFCDGQGLTYIIRGVPAPCGCVLRAIFRACYARFRHCVTKEKFLSKVSLVPCLGKDTRRTYVRMDEDYICDFSNISRHALTSYEYNIFRYHFLLGADWRLCCRQMKVERGDYFHTLYRIQRKLGRAFREMEPYALFPVDEYFGSQPIKQTVAIMPKPPKPQPVHPPLRKIA